MREPRIVVSKRSVAVTAAVAAFLIGAVVLADHAPGFFAAGETESGTLSRNSAHIGGASPSVPPPSGKAVPSSAPTTASTVTPSVSSTGGSASRRPKPSQAGGKPNASNTGVVPGTALKVVSGNQTYGSSANGRIFSGKDFHGYVRVTGADITFRNCIFRGGKPSGNNALLDTSDSTGPIVVRDSEFVPTTPAATIDGLWLKNTTVSRANVHGTVDGIKADSDTVIRQSYIHDMQSFASDPNQGGGETHNDAIQILNGSGITIDGNNLATAGKDPNSAIQITQDFGPTSHVAITDNWADYGGCTFNFAHKVGSSMSIGPVTGNRFGRHQGSSGCAILISTKTTLVKNSGNVWDDTGAPIPAPQQHD
jgi:hypothetical protein